MAEERMDLLNDLPAIILPSIFKFLPLEDLKNWRLVSKHWYDVCSVAGIIKYEKFVFQYGQCGGDIARLANYIKQCRRMRPNIEFYGFSLKRLPLAVWTHFGESLTSLRIHECYVNEDVVTEIILRCPNLTRLHLQAHSTYENVILSEKTLDFMIAAGVKRYKLRSFKLFTRHYPVPDVIFHKILQIFPNVEIFGRDFFFSDTSMNAVIEFFSGLTQLKKLELRILLILARESREVKGQLLNKSLCEVLKRLTQIKALKFETNCFITFTKSEFSRFLQATKDLESLRLNCHEFKIDFCTSTYPFPAVEYKFLTDLQLFCPASTIFDSNQLSEMCFEILNRCSLSLKYLSLPEVFEDKLTECILRDHNDLKKFNVVDGKCHDDCFTKNRMISIDRLPNLEYLNFNFHERYCATDILYNLNCSRLKIFKTKCTTKENLIELMEILSVIAPLLETLYLLAEYCMFVEEYVSYFQKFKHLRFLVLEKRWDSDGTDSPRSDTREDAIEKLFHTCPSLVYVIYPTSRIVCYRSTESVTKNRWYSSTICNNLNTYRTVEYTGL